MPLALSTGHQIGLAAAAAIFIAFALVSALLIPRRHPDFPGRARNLYIVVTVLLFVGMMAAVFVFGKEGEESEAGGETAAETTTATTGTTDTTPEGDAAAGRQVFVSAGCGGCHALGPAGTDGTIGPDLDEALQGKDAEFIHESIVEPNAEITEGYQPNVMPQDYDDQLSDEQLADLVAFLQSSS